MDKRYQDADIQSLSIGPGGELKINVGQRFNIQLKGQEDKGKQEVYVSRIIRDEANHFYFGVVSYAIYVTLNGKEHLWQSLENVPVRITYNLIYNDEVHNDSGPGVSHGRHGQEEEEEVGGNRY